MFSHLALASLAVQIFSVSIARWATTTLGQTTSANLDPAPITKRDILVLSDISNEPDDAQSLTRFLLYANEFNIHGLVATTSFWQKDSTHPDEMHSIIDAYSAVVDNLNVHTHPSLPYPPASDLHAKVCSGLVGYGMSAVDPARLDESSKLIIDAVDGIASDGHIWILCWGGANSLAQALLYVQGTRSESDFVTFMAKIRVYAISDQDDAGPWIRLHYPSLFYIASVHGWNQYGLAAWTGISGESYYHFNPNGPDPSLVSKEWIAQNIQIGAYGKTAYPDHLFIPEGDTPSFLSLIPNGLSPLPEKPEWGGWGGRYIPSDQSPLSKHYSDAADTVLGLDGNLHTSSQATIWRWREAYQGDFAARMQWTLTGNYSAANHAPVIILNGSCSLEPFVIQVLPDSTLFLDASSSSSSSPSSDLTYIWTHYREPTATQWWVSAEVPELHIEDNSPHTRSPPSPSSSSSPPPSHQAYENIKIKIPSNARACRDIMDPTKKRVGGCQCYHLILEVVVDGHGQFPMRSYRRVLVQVVHPDEDADADSVVAGQRSGDFQDKHEEL